MQFKWADTSNIFTRPYWRYLYAKYAKPGSELSLEDFRTLVILMRMVNRQEQRQELARRVRFLPIRILNYVVDITQSRAIEDYRQHLAREFHLFLYRQYLETDRVVGGEPYIIHLADLEVCGSIVIAHIEYYVGKKQNIQKDVKAILNHHFKIPKQGINIQKIGSGEIKVVFSVDK